MTWKLMKMMMMGGHRPWTGKSRPDHSIAHLIPWLCSDNVEISRICWPPTRGSPRISRRRRRIKRRGSELHVNANETRGESIYGMNLHANIVIRSIRSCATICFRVVVLRGWRAKRRKNVCTDFVKHGQDRERHNEPLSIDRFKSNSNYFHGLYLSALNM